MINRRPSRILEWKAPYTVLFGTTPDMSMLRPFGCLAFAVNVSPNKDIEDNLQLPLVQITQDPGIDSLLDNDEA